MRTILHLFAMMAITCGVLLAGCTKDAPTNDNPSTVTTELTLAQSIIDASAEGGSYSVDYTLVGGYEGIGVQASCESEWITDLEITATSITFTVMKNDRTAPRTATVSVKYPGLEDKGITVAQLGGDSLFNLAISNETSTTCQSTVVCSDPNMAYIVYIAEVSYFYQANITTEQELFADDYNYFKSLADDSGTNLGQFLFINDIAFYGQSDIQWTGITPNRDYVLYAYGIAFNENMSDYSLATPVSYMMVRLEGASLRDVEFDVTVTVNGPEASYEFEPTNWQGYYYIDIYSERDYLYLPEGETPSDDYCQVVVDKWLATMEQLRLSGYTGEQIIQIMCLMGKDSYSQLLEADTRYMMSFYAVELIDGMPQVVSRPYLVHFKTEPVEKSDMTFDIAVTDVYTRVADIRVTPTDPEVPYTIAIVNSEMLPEGSNEDIINWYITSYRVQSFKGEFYTHLNSLKPETDYTLLVFGYYGGVITTDLNRVDFTTEPEGVCENSVIRVDFMGPYSPMELAEHYPNALNGMEAMYEQYGFYVMWAEIITEKPSQDVFYFHYEPSELDAGEDAVFADLVSYPAAPVSFLTARSGVEFVMCAVTMDYRGNYSDMWKSELFSYEYNAETKRHIEELISKLISPSRKGKLMVVAPDGRHEEIESIIAVRK